MYADVLIKYEVKSLDKTFTYLIPDNLKKDIKIGMKVKVPFANKNINGFVLGIKNNYDEEFELKEIIELISTDLFLTKEQLELGKYLKEKTLCSLMTAYETMLPSGLKAKSETKINKKYDVYLIINKSEEIIKKYILDNKRYKNQLQVLNDLLLEKKVLKNRYNHSSIITLSKKELIAELKVQKNRLEFLSKEHNINLKMTTLQQEAFEKVKNTLKTNCTHLIYGVTGSGKTLVYINLIKEALKLNKTALILVPEISLTTQIINQFYNYFGNDVAILHSALSIGEKHDEYLKILKKEVHVVVGTRSAIFAPLENIGIIVIDEEHSDTYKQDNNPRYDAKDMATYRSKYNSCPLVLGSATPSLPSMARALKKIFNLITMPKRVNEGLLPTVKIVDMNEEMKKRNPILSEELKNEIGNKLIKQEQIILLLNRRGYATFINCSNCGYIYKCPHCEISLTYHKSSNSLRCHYCGYTVFKDEKCPNCKEKDLNYLGLGTEKLETELKKTFPNAKIVRMDADTTTNKGSHEKIIKSFENHKYDILLGTQMISKGLDFPLVTLVGVINADTSLNMPDYKSNETTFSLLNQVSGRSGRGKKSGTVIIQTFNPNNLTLNFVKNNNYKDFFNYEMSIRKKLLYPPYIYIASIKVISNNYDLAKEEAIKVEKYLKNNLCHNEILLGPTTAAIFKFQNKYRFQLIIKYKNEKEILRILMELDRIYLLNKNVYLEIDLNPSRI